MGQISNIYDSTNEYQMLLRVKNDRFRKATCDFTHDNLRNTELLRQQTDQCIMCVVEGP